MSLYVEWLNKIKAIATYDWLTDTQRNVYDRIATKWQNQPFICVCGPAGCGKSFIARLLAREKDYRYGHDIKSIEEGSQQVIIDGEDYSRLMRDMARLRRLKRVIVLTRRPPQDPMSLVEIVLTEKDVMRFQHNLTKYGVLESFVSDVDGTDLGHILRAESVARGSSHGD